jgi:hypothetical protein
MRLGTTHVDIKILWEFTPKLYWAIGARFRIQLQQPEYLGQGSVSNKED